MEAALKRETRGLGLRYDLGGGGLAVTELARPVFVRIRVRVPLGVCAWWVCCCCGGLEGWRHDWRV